MSTLAGSVIHIDELLRGGEIPDNVELADLLFFGCRAGGSRRGKVRAFAGCFCPMSLAGQELEGLRVFNENIHKA